MNTGTITAVGIDVSKRKNTVAARRPGGEVVLLPFDVKHDAEGIGNLITTLNTLDGEVRIVMEHTSMYWRPIALALKNAVFFVSVVNAILIHNFSDNSLRKVKADALKIANYALTFWQDLREYSVEDETRQMLKIQSRLYERTTATGVMLKNGLIALLDQTFPGANKLFRNEGRNVKGHVKWVDFFSRFWHKECVAALLSEYELVMYMQGTGEIGDIRRFSHKGALAAFAGVDAPPYQSGTFDSKIVMFPSVVLRI